MRKKKKKKQLDKTVFPHIGNASTNILHPSHWQSHLAMEARIERRRERGLLRNESDQRQARRYEYGQLLGVFVERQGRSEIWHICEWWSGDLLLSFSNDTGRYELPTGESGSIRSRNIFHAMQLAAGIQDDVVRNEVALAESARMEIVPCGTTRGWDVKQRATNRTLLSFVRKGSGSYQIFFPAFFVTAEFVFAEVVEVAEMRKEVSQLGSLIKLREIESGEIETYLLTQVANCQTPSPDIEALRYSCPLGSQIVGRRIGERFSVEIPKGRIEYEVVSLN